MSDDMSAYKEVFLSESAEYIQSITDGLLALESDPFDLEPVETVFRGAHSLKGMAAAMCYDRTAELTHKMESLMDTVRQRLQPIDSSLIDLMLRAVDSVRDLIDDESSGGQSVDIDDIVSAILARAEIRSTPEEDVAVQEVIPPEVAEAMPDVGSRFVVTITLAETCVLKAVRAYMAIKRLGHMGTVIETRPSVQQIEDEEFDRAFEVILRTQEEPDAIEKALSVISEIEGVVVALVEDELAEKVMEIEARSPKGRLSVPKIAETQTVRISIGHLDNMVNLVGELVIIRSRFDKIAHDLGSLELGETLSVLEQVSGDLQHEVMQTRMVPVGNIFNRFPRMVRDLARDLGKDVAFEMEGLDIELDRTVLDEIGDPIVHLLRNSIDHGIEAPDVRESAGKPARGTVRLIARREREQVRVIVTDDGAGMDADRIWQKAVERGMVASADRDSYAESDILMLTCVPGFSTVKEATKVSGRGVGMDVVKGKIEYLGGTLVIKSRSGVGTEMILALPLTLAIIQALLVASAGQVFAVPLSAVSEVLSPEEVTLKTVDGTPVVVLRDGSVAPLYLLDEVIGAAPRSKRQPLPGEHIVLMEIGEEINALAVGGLVGRQEVVIKPLSPLFRGLYGLGGATVLGDGRVALILDPRTLFHMGA
ncbi:MAG: chemotaxis protein CheA [Coriobacteriia bacterium]|nr:chemotaxis protein CheA [Coriobacteriia bacterium]